MDLAIVMPTGPQPGVTVKPLGREELVIVVNRDHPFAKRRSIEPAELATLRLILYEKNTAMQNLVDGYFEVAQALRPTSPWKWKIMKQLRAWFGPDWVRRFCRCARLPMSPRMARCESCG